MGLSFSPGGASWDHHGFNRMREQLAHFEGIDDLRAWWKNPLRDGQDTPLYDLLDAEDVRGFFSAYQCERMLPRLKAILRDLPDRLHPYDHSNLQALVEGMEHCAGHGCAMSWG